MIENIKAVHLAVAAAVGLLGTLGFQVMSPSQQFEQHKIEHVELSETLNKMQSNLEDIGANLGLLIRVRCLEMDPRDIELAGLDCS